jgi:S1-C subfamily serine protease
MLKWEDLEKLAAILGGVVVRGSGTDGPAARAGVREGDIVLRANGVETPSIDALLRAKRTRRDGVTLELYRYGQHLHVEVQFADAHGRSNDARSASQRLRSASRAAWYLARSTRSLSN